jgi:hypothetical protein
MYFLTIQYAGGRWNPSSLAKVAVLRIHVSLPYVE